MKSKEIGSAIKKARIKKELTQEQLAELLFTSSKTISRWERGERVPEKESIKLIEKVLDLKYDKEKDCFKNPNSKRQNIKNIILLGISFLLILLIAIGLTRKVEETRIYEFTNSNESHFIYNGKIVNSPKKSVITLSQIAYKEDQDTKIILLSLYVECKNKIIYNEAYDVLEEYNEPKTIKELLEKLHFDIIVDSNLSVNDITIRIELIGEQDKEYQEEYQINLQPLE